MFVSCHCTCPADRLPSTGTRLRLPWVIRVNYVLYTRMRPDGQRSVFWVCEKNLLRRCRHREIIQKRGSIRPKTQIDHCHKSP
jgi:hypothetical protein